MGLGWKSVKLSHKISSLPPGSVWAGNTMRITFLLAFQQFCFRAWAKQGSAEAWEPGGDTNTRSELLQISTCNSLPPSGRFSCQLNSSAWAHTSRWRWFSQPSLWARSRSPLAMQSQQQPLKFYRCETRTFRTGS